MREWGWECRGMVSHLACFDESLLSDNRASPVPVCQEGLNNIVKHQRQRRHAARLEARLMR